MDLLSNIKEIKATEYRLLSNSGNKGKIYENKWCCCVPEIPDKPTIKGLLMSV